ncbi:MAG: hypothetical protein MJ105_09350 [Lachnospiraceae bacterium]|nr:hypothetical protein [Lachnospiraceae bacterium]
MTVEKTCYYHLPGLFEFYDFYEKFLPLYREHPEYFYSWCAIGSIYGAPGDALWGGGRVGNGERNAKQVLKLLRMYDISARLTFSNSLLTEEQLKDRQCNELCRLFACDEGKHGVIIYSGLLLEYLREQYPSLYFVSSTTKVITEEEDLFAELNREEYRFVVPDFRHNPKMQLWEQLTKEQKEKVELLCNECCDFGCKARKECYESVSRKVLGLPDNHRCQSAHAAEGYVFSKAMENNGFISVEAILEKYLPIGIHHFKIEGRSLGSAYLLEFILYYMTKPEYQLKVREALYLDHSLDLF